MPKHRVEVEGITYYMGRIPSHFDARNLRYRIQDTTSMLPPHDQVWESKGPILNQGSTPSCTGHGALGWEMCLPGDAPTTPDDQKSPDPRAVLIWQQAQLEGFGHIDPNDGATIHDIAKVLSDPMNEVLAVNGKPRMGSYVWGFDMNEILSFISNEGPMIIGVTWYKSMFSPDADGIAKIDPDSGVAGGHCVYIRGCSLTKGLVGPIANSWSATWGKQGEFYLPVGQFKLLLPGGEFCAGVENVL